MPLVVWVLGGSLLTLVSLGVVYRVEEVRGKRFGAGLRGWLDRGLLRLYTQLHLQAVSRFLYAGQWYMRRFFHAALTQLLRLSRTT